MSYVAPSSQTTGDLITASIWNQNIVSNVLLLKTSIANSGALISPSIATTTSTGADYAHVIDTDAVVVLAGDVTVLLASATASSTGRTVGIKNWGTGTVTYYGSGVSIDNSTSTGRTIAAGDALEFTRFRSTDWEISSAKVSAGGLDYVQMQSFS